MSACARGSVCACAVLPRDDAMPVSLPPYPRGCVIPVSNETNRVKPLPVPAFIRPDLPVLISECLY
ncbi:MAG: hypothetical protein GY820_48595 [Gammaproteobacteria bacterium]|nr:hypothetical protein [Gammaproteobacteria bacterium]